MNYINFKNCYAIVTGTFLFVGIAHASVIAIDAPQQALANRQPVVAIISLDPNGDTLSGISGNFSFPSDLFDIGDISTKGSIISLFVKQPSLSLDKYLDGRTHVTFEGIFPGGYSGVHSPYEAGVSQGVVFSVTLVPKGKGVGSLIVDDVVFHSFDSQATVLPSSVAYKSITVPLLVGPPSKTRTLEREEKNDLVTALVTRDQLINNNAWYLLVNEEDGTSAIEKIFVAETDDWTAELVSENTWKEVQNPYVLVFQNRSKFVHVKVLHRNGVYTLKTIPPVENSTKISSWSRILIGITTVLLLSYLYAKSFFTLRKKNSAEKS